MIIIIIIIKMTFLIKEVDIFNSTTINYQYGPLICLRKHQKIKNKSWITFLTNVKCCEILFLNFKTTVGINNAISLRSNLV